jgi:hypothetical protein
MTKLYSERADACHIISVVNVRNLFIDLGCHNMVNGNEVFGFPFWIGGSW